MAILRSYNDVLIMVSKIIGGHSLPQAVACPYCPYQHRLSGIGLILNKN